MKKLLTILLFVLGMNMVNAQGYIGFHETLVDSIFTEMGFEVEKGTITDEDRSVKYIQQIQDDLIVTMYLNVDDFVFVSVFSPLTEAKFLSMVEYNINNFVQMEEFVWHNHMEWGVIIIILEVPPNDLPPYFVVTFEIYNV